jgi:hypothetical protein
VRHAGAYHCCRSSSSSPGLVSVTTSLRRYGTAEGSISHLSRHDIARQLGLQMGRATSSRAPRGPQRPATGVLGRRPDPRRVRLADQRETMPKAAHRRSDRHQASSLADHELRDPAPAENHAVPRLSAAHRVIAHRLYRVRDCLH